MPELPSSRRRPWVVALPLLVVVVLFVAWSGFWLYAENKAAATLEAWRAREAQAGRSYRCGNQTIGGYPFRFEVICKNIEVNVASMKPSLSLSGSGLHVAAQVYDPTLLIGELHSPVTVRAAGEPPVRVTWTLAQMSLRGRPAKPERASLVLDGARIDELAGANALTLLDAKHLEGHVRIDPRSSASEPLIDLAIELDNAQAPTLQPPPAMPFDFSAVGVLHGLNDLRPVPIAARLKQLQAAGGKLEVTRARVHQGDVTAVAAGTLGLTESGRLNGELMMTVAGIDHLLPALGIDPQAIANDDNNRIGAALGKLDRIVPGLGRFARANAGAGLAAGIALLGKPAELEGHKAVTLPLRFADGIVYLGPLRVGIVKPLF